MFVLFLWLRCQLLAQTTGATFGETVKLGGTPSDMVRDEPRGRLYLVNQNAGRVDVYDYAAKRVAGTYPTGSGPVAAAMSMDGAYLYVANNTSSTLTGIDLKLGVVVATVSLSAKPSGVEAGADGPAAHHSVNATRRHHRKAGHHLSGQTDSHA